MTLSHRFIFGATVTMVAPLSLATYFTIVSLVVVPSVFLSGVRMDYYHLPWHFQYSITRPMGYLDLSEFFIRRHTAANEEASPAGATTGQPRLHMSIPRDRDNPKHQLRHVSCCSATAKQFFLCSGC